MENENEINYKSDYLSFTKDPSILKMIKNEKILFTDKIIKINRYNMSQERNIMITNEAIYNLKKMSKENKYLKTRFKKENSYKNYFWYNNK